MKETCSICDEQKPAEFECRRTGLKACKECGPFLVLADKVLKEAIRFGICEPPKREPGK